MNKYYLAFLAFVLTFCAPWAIASAIGVYAQLGSKIGQAVYEVTHDDRI